MEKRKLGHSGIEIAPLAFGGNVFGWTADTPTSFRLLDGFVDAGLNMIDTADVYSAWADGHEGGESEHVIGQWLERSGRRDEVIIATKVGKLEGRKGLAPDNIRQAVENSLRRLKTDVIDLYQSHAFDPDVPQADTLGAYQRLIDAGKIRAIGASNFSATQLAEALKISAEQNLPRYEVLQPEYNLVARKNYEQALEPLIRKEDIGVISYFSLAAGFLTGKYREKADLEGRARAGMVEKYMNAYGKRVLRALDDVAERRNANPAQVALAWLMARPGLTAPIASATSTEQLDDLIAATQLHLDSDDIEALNHASD